MATKTTTKASEYVGTLEASAIIGVTIARVQQLIWRGQLPATKVSARAWLIRRADAEAYRDSERKVGAPSRSP